ncbi:MAG: methionyl-tRNA formyltransferase [Puniceicoccaceae bacterium]|nr:MAG: methionyl-tRNA formyltransferase [Puniceicoccaceae bacterium]
MGSDEIALPVLDWLLEGADGIAELVAVYTQPDRPHGRGKRVTANAIKERAQARKLAVRQPVRLDAAGLEDFAAFQPHLAVVMAYGHFLPRRWLELPERGFFNLHASLLPKYRGASPLQGALVCGERETGVTLMKMTPPMDAGPVAGLDRVAVDPLETAGSLEPKLARSALRVLQRHWAALLDGSIRLEEQDASAATYTRKLVKADGVLDFAASAEELARRINGLFPWPGTAIEVGGVPVRIGSAEAVATAADDPPGTVVAADDAGLQLATGSGVLRLLRLQKPGGRMLPAPEFLRGFSIRTGTRILSRPMPELVRPEPFPRPAGP